MEDNMIITPVSSGHKIKVGDFQMFYHNPVKKSVAKYPQFSQSPTLLKHFIEIKKKQSSTLLSIDQLTKTGQESLNKNFVMSA